MKEGNPPAPGYIHEFRTRTVRKRTALLACPSIAIFCVGLATTPLPREVRAAPPASRSREISVVSLNMAKAASTAAVLRDFQDAPAVRDADILLLQEVASPKGSESTAEKLAAELGRHVVWAPAAQNVNDLGLAILSRWPLEDRRTQPLRAYNLRFHSRSRIVLSATTRTPHGNVRVWNTHLDTRLNTAERHAQIEPVLREISAWPGARILGGDFNSNPYYWVGRVLPVPFVQSQANGLRTYLLTRGFATPLPPRQSTFDLPGMQLDWIWTKGLRPGTWAVYPMRFSDHHAVLVRAGW